MQISDSVIKKIGKLRKVGLPAGWKLVANLPIGGVRSVGFDKTSEDLLLVSLGGRGLVDCGSGEIVLRDKAEYFDHELELEADGIGKYSGVRFRMSGIFGGGLPLQTTDGWLVNLIHFSSSRAGLLLFEQDFELKEVQNPGTGKYWLLSEETDIRAFGFSWTGKSLVYATASEVSIFGRQ